MSTDDQNPEESPGEAPAAPEDAAAQDAQTFPDADAESPDATADFDVQSDTGPAGPAGDFALPSEEAEPEAASVDFRELVDALPGSDPQSLSVLFDLSLPVAIELGRTRMSVQDVLSLGRGSVVQLDRLAGEPVDVFVGDRRFAEGEVVVLGEQFGVRITRIIAGAIPNTPVAIAS